jgi:hypothetical protein
MKTLIVKIDEDGVNPLQDPDSEELRKHFAT